MDSVLQNDQICLINRPKTFLIDMENVNFAGLYGYESLSKGDEIHIFIGKCNDKIPMSFLAFCQNNEIQIHYHDIALVGKNSLDFQITTFLGILAAQSILENQKKNFYIISNDKGYESSIRLLRTLYKDSIFVDRIENIEHIKSNRTTKKEHTQFPAQIVVDLDENISTDSSDEKQQKNAIPEKSVGFNGLKLWLLNNLVFPESFSLSERQAAVGLFINFYKKEKGKQKSDDKFILAFKKRLRTSFAIQKAKAFYDNNDSHLQSIYHSLRIQGW